jgi:hypothetical protein
MGDEKNGTKFSAGVGKVFKWYEKKGFSGG